MNDLLQLAYAKGGISDTSLHNPEPVDFSAFCEKLKNAKPKVGPKDGPYFVRGPINGSGTRADENVPRADVAILDADSRITDDGETEKGAPHPSLVHEALTNADVAHAIYTSHSHKPERPRYRVLVPARLESKRELEAVVDWLLGLLHCEAVPLAPVKENTTWAQGWFYPRLAAPDSEYLTYTHDTDERLDVAEIMDWYEASHEPPPKAPRSTVQGDAPWNWYDTTHGTPESLRALLERHGYRFVCEGKINGETAYRYLHPASETGNPGVRLFKSRTDNWVVMSSHGADVLNDGYTHDAFGLFTLLDHGGDTKAAVKALAALGYVSEQSAENDDTPPPAWPVLTEGAFHGPLGALAKLATEQSEADPAAVLLTALTYAGASIGPDAYVPVGETHHPPRLDTVLVGASSRARKGTSHDPVKRAFAIVFQDESLMPLPVTGGPLSSGEGLVNAVRDPSEETDDEGNPVDPGAPDKRLLVVEGEYAGSLKVMAREGNTLSPVLRDAWDHGNLAPLTKHNRINATGAHICYVGHITGFELKKLMAEAEIWNGLANRNLWACVRRPKKVALPKPMDLDRLMPIVTQIAEALVWVQNSTKSAQFRNTSSSVGPATTAFPQNPQNPLEIRFSPDTERQWPKLYERLSADHPGVYGVVTARAEAQVIRIALIFAVMDRSTEIRPEHIKAALHVWDFCDASARFIFGEIEADPVKNRILEALAEREHTQTEINDLFHGHKKKDELKSKLQELDASGKVGQRNEGGGQGKGKAKTVWFLRQPLAEIADFAEM